MQIKEASWQQVKDELDNLEDALRDLELAIPERVPGAPNELIAVRIAGVIEATHANVNIIREWAARTR